MRLDTSAQGRAGFHRYHSAELVTDLECAQLPSGMLDGIHSWVWPSGAHVHVAVDDDGDRHVVQSGPRTGGKTTTHVLEGQYEAVQRVGGRVWRVPVTAFWQAHRDAAQVYSDLVADWAQLREGMTAWDLYGGAGVFAAVLAQAVGETGKVVTVDPSRTPPAGRHDRRVRRWPTWDGCRWSPTPYAVPWPRSGGGPTSRCWTRREREPAAT